ncbi:MAG TPA: carboxypeptidase-like regulatory domain-containing protein, partial [Candidatus Parabacteroides intestinavium]|nr:carboxypeptidase-like regulatory domain-containing protein [Candidatus Parabacteroides intestinavium]
MKKINITQYIKERKLLGLTLEKIPLSMKLSFIFMVSSVGLANAVGSYAQETRISLNAENKTVQEVLDQIEEKSDFSFFYNNRHVDLNRRVTVSVDNADIFKVLDTVFIGTNVVYSVVDNRIVLSLKNEFPTIAQNVVRIMGTVVDATGTPVIGANVAVKGTTNGTITDMEGRFSLEVELGATLEVSYIGYLTQAIKVNSKDNLSITLKEDTKALDEVVVVGYGTQKKANLTGAIDVIDKESISQRSSGNLSQSIRGLAPSMNFSLNSAGFQPGADMSVSIRGMGSLNGGSPYVLIDGFPGDMNLLNPEDVESISILKDAAASAIYGARAPYGVILITTKKGKKNEKMSISYSGMMMINSPQKLPQMLDSYTYSRVQNEAGQNLGGSPMSNDAIDRIIAFQNKDWDELRRLIPNYPEGADITSGAYPSGEYWDSANLNYANNDW